MTEGQIGAVFAGLILLVNVIVSSGLLMQIKGLLKENTVKTEEIKNLVNGQHGVTLSKLADVREELASVSNRRTDDAKAQVARQDSDDHNEVNKSLDVKP